MQSRRSSTKEEECCSCYPAGENVLVTKHSINSDLWPGENTQEVIQFLLNILTNKASGYKVYMPIILVTFFSLGADDHYMVPGKEI